MNHRLNLLPQSKQRELYYEQLLHSVSVAVGLAVAVLLLGVVAQIGTRIILKQQLSGIEADIQYFQQAVDKEENTALKQEIRVINNQMKDFQNLYQNTPLWSDVLEAFARQVPNGVLVTDFSGTLETGEIEIAGYSPTRELVIELYNNINADKEHFKDINYPLENVAKPTDVEFRYTFYLKEGVFKPQ